MYPIENSLPGQCPHHLQKSLKPSQPKDTAWKANIILGNLEKEIRDAPRVSTRHSSGDQTQECYAYPTCTGCNTYTMNTHHRHLCTASYTDSAYPASGNHIRTALTAPEILCPLYACRKTVPE